MQVPQMGPRLTKGTLEHLALSITHFKSVKNHYFVTIFKKGFIHGLCIVADLLLNAQISVHSLWHVCNWILFNGNVQFSDNDFCGLFIYLLQPSIISVSSLYWRGMKCPFLQHIFHFLDTYLFKIDNRTVMSTSQNSIVRFINFVSKK